MNEILSAMICFFDESSNIYSFMYTWIKWRLTPLYLFDNHNKIGCL